MKATMKISDRVVMRQDTDSHEDLKGCGGVIQSSYWNEEVECEVYIILWDAHTYDGEDYNSYVTEECACNLD